MTEYLLEMRGINKAFPGVQALAEVDLTISPGEILALVGENGAGKSTLMRVLNGVFLPDSGQITWQGRPVSIHSPHDAQALGIAMIHQELALIPYLDIGKNIYLGREPERLPGIVHWGRLYRQAQGQLERIGLAIDPRTPVRRLPPAQQQMVEVVKALSLNARLIVMDEPTSSLTEREVETLFAQMRLLREQGVSIIFISHRMEEIFTIADRVTVLRDGQLVGTEAIADLTTERVISMMVGRELGEVFRADEPRALGQDVVLEVDGLTAPGAIEDISFTLCQGEILGIAGLVGAGRTELAETIFGARRASAGTVRLHGAQAAARTAEAAQAGPRYASGDVLGVIGGALILLAFLLLPWLVNSPALETVPMNALGLVGAAEYPLYSTPLALLLVGLGGLAGLAASLWNLLLARAAWPAYAIALAGAVSLIYPVTYFIENGGAEAKLIAPLGPAFWLSLLGGIGLLAQVLMTRPLRGIERGGIFGRGFARPAQAIAYGIGFVPEDRKGQGLFLHMTVVANVVLAILTRLARWGLIRQGQVRSIGDRFVAQLDIRTPSLFQRVQNLSGGNQQKVVIAKWLTRQPRVLILDEPTRGIDVGAKAEIYRLMHQLAAQGVGILMISSELPEILGISDRILVMREGRLMGEFDPRQATQDDIMSAATDSLNGRSRT